MPVLYIDDEQKVPFDYISLAPGMTHQNRQSSYDDDLKCFYKDQYFTEFEATFPGLKLPVS